MTANLTILNSNRVAAFNLINNGTAFNTGVVALSATVLTTLQGLEAQLLRHSELVSSSDQTKSIYHIQLTTLIADFTTFNNYVIGQVDNFSYNLSIATSHIMDKIAYQTFPAGKIPEAADIIPYFGTIMGSGLSSLNTVADVLDQFTSILATSPLTSTNLSSIASGITILQNTDAAITSTMQSEQALIIQAVADLTQMANTASVISAWNNPWGKIVLQSVGTTALQTALSKLYP